MGSAPALEIAAVLGSRQDVLVSRHQPGLAATARWRARSLSPLIGNGSGAEPHSGSLCRSLSSLGMRKASVQLMGSAGCPLGQLIEHHRPARAQLGRRDMHTAAQLQGEGGSVKQT